MYELTYDTNELWIIMSGENKPKLQFVDSVIEQNEIAKIVDDRIKEILNV